MAFSIRNSLPQIDEERLAAIEAELGAPFPAPYRRFLLAHNGGSPTPNSFRLKGKDYAFSDVNWLAGVADHAPAWADLVAGIEVYRGRMPPNIIPVGHDSGGNAICISLSGPDRGAVYFWAHEFEAGIRPSSLPGDDCLGHKTRPLGQALENLARGNRGELAAAGQVGSLARDHLLSVPRRAAWSTQCCLRPQALTRTNPSVPRSAMAKPGSFYGRPNQLSSVFPLHVGPQPLAEAANRASLSDGRMPLGAPIP